jgi:hypothetical protein
VLILCGIIASLVGVIVVARLRSGGSISALSLAMPLTGLGWLGLLGIKILRLHVAPLAAEPPAVSDRPSRRPPNWDGVPGPKPSQRPRPDRQVNA